MLKRTLALLLLALSAAAVAEPPRIRILSTEPRITGPALSFTETLLTRAGLTYSVETVPWARAYYLAQQDPDVLLFTVGRTAEHEAQFEWIGETFPIAFKAYRLRQRTDIAIRSPADLRHYRLSVVRDSSIVPYLRGLGLAESSFEPGLQFITTIEDHWPKLQHNRADLFVATSLSVAGMCADGDLDCTQIASAWTFSDQRTMAWLAFSLRTDGAVIERAAAAYKAMRADGSLRRMLAPLTVLHDIPDNIPD